jgi:glycosyltransferase involved in cell wall biosynthesis
MQVTPIYNGISTDNFFAVTENQKKMLRIKLNLPIESSIWISSGVLIGRKDPLFLIRVWQRTIKSDHNSHLVFIGGGHLQDECRHLSRQCSNIHIIGNVDNAAEYLQASDCYVSASQAEGFPLAVLEAMACGLPVLLSDIEPHKEILNLAPQAGFLYELQNEESFISSLHKILSGDYEVMSKAAVKIIHDQLNTGVMSKLYQDIYYKFLF